MMESSRETVLGREKWREREKEGGRKRERKRERENAVSCLASLAKHGKD